MINKRIRLKKYKKQNPGHVLGNKHCGFIALVILCTLIFPLIVLSRYFTASFSRESLMILCILIIALFIVTTIISGNELSCGIIPLFSSSKKLNRYTPVAAGCFFSLLYYLYITAKVYIRPVSPDFTLLSISLLSLVSIFLDTLIGKKSAREYLIDKNEKKFSLSDSFSAYYCPYVLIICAVIFTASLISNSNVELAILYTLMSSSLTPLFSTSFESIFVYIALKKAYNMGISFRNTAAFFKISGLRDNLDIISADSIGRPDFSFNDIDVFIGDNNIQGNYDLIIRNGNSLRNAISIARSTVTLIKANFAITALSYLCAVIIRLFTNPESATLFCLFLFVFVLPFDLFLLKNRLDNIKKAQSLHGN